MDKNIIYLSLREIKWVICWSPSLLNFKTIGIIDYIYIIIETIECFFINFFLILNLNLHEIFSIFNTQYNTCNVKHSVMKCFREEGCVSIKSSTHFTIYIHISNKLQLDFKDIYHAERTSVQPIYQSLCFSLKLPAFQLK